MTKATDILFIDARGWLSDSRLSAAQPASREVFLSFYHMAARKKKEN